VQRVKPVEVRERRRRQDPVARGEPVFVRAERAFDSIVRYGCGTPFGEAVVPEV